MPTSWATALVLVVSLAGCATFHAPKLVEGSITAIAFSPDEQLLAFADQAEIWVMDAEGRERINVLRAAPADMDEAPPHDLRHGVGDNFVFLDNDRIATTGMGGLVTIWDVHSGSRLGTIPPPSADTFASTIDHTPFEDRLVIGTMDGRLLYTELTGNVAAPLHTLATLSGYVLDLQFNRDGKYFASAAEESEVIIWDTELLQEFGRLEGTTGVLRMSLVPEAPALLTAGEEVEIWEFLTLAEAEEIDDPSMAGQVLGIGAVATVVAASIVLVPVAAAGGAPYAAASGGLIGLGAAAGGAAIIGMVDHEFIVQNACSRTAAISPDGRTIVTTTRGPSHNVLAVIDRVENRVTEKKNVEGLICEMEFSPDNSRLLAATLYGVWVIDTHTWE